MKDKTKSTIISWLKKKIGGPVKKAVKNTKRVGRMAEKGELDPKSVNYMFNPMPHFSESKKYQ